MVRTSEDKKRRVWDKYLVCIINSAVASSAKKTGFD